MRIIVNGNEQQITAHTSISALLETANIDPEQVVTELNGLIIAPEHYEETHLNNGDTIELIQFVGGG
ncbi:MAG TPA: sulfur carrier protein ThiS [Pelovirga sp.]|nr:sulfur carrier protein ThiS [Pelovirga sp.]